MECRVDLVANSHPPISAVLLAKITAQMFAKVLRKTYGKTSKHQGPQKSWKESSDFTLLIEQMHVMQHAEC